MNQHVVMGNGYLHTRGPPLCAFAQLEPFHTRLKVTVPHKSPPWKPDWKCRSPATSSYPHMRVRNVHG